MSFLSVGTAIVNVRVGEAGAPHHYASEGWIALIFADERGELVRRDVVHLTGWGTIGSERSSRHTDEDLGTSRRGSRYK